jgi:hypothetical protein
MTRAILGPSSGPWAAAASCAILFTPHMSENIPCRSQDGSKCLYFKDNRIHLKDMVGRRLYSSGPLSNDRGEPLDDEGRVIRVGGKPTATLPRDQDIQASLYGDQITWYEKEKDEYVVAGTVEAHRKPIIQEPDYQYPRQVKLKFSGTF